MASFVEDISADPDTITLEQDFSTLNRGFSPDLFDCLDRDDSAMSSANGTQTGDPAQLFSPEQQAWLETWLASRADGATAQVSPPVGGTQPTLPAQSGKYIYSYSKIREERDNYYT